MAQSKAQQDDSIIPEEVRETVEAARARVEAVRGQLAEADTQLREVVREHPVACLVGALASGYFIGRLLSRL